jgi:hypothetical protein
VEFKDEELEDTEPIETTEEESTQDKGVDVDDDTIEEEKYHTAYPVVGIVDAGPTSFAELDAEEEAREQARKVRGVAFDTEELVSNIIHSGMEPSEKEGALKNLASDFGTRLRSVMNGSKEIELSLEEAEFIAYANSLPDQSTWTTLTEKAKMAAEARGNLPDSAFAHIESGGEKDSTGKTKPLALRHFPIHDETHVRSALAQAAQSLQKGGKSAEVARLAMPKISTAAKEMGIGMPSEENDNGLLVQKDNNGDWRWIGWVSNNFKDREGDIITEKAHQEFVQYLDDNPNDAPRFWSWHTKETERKHRADWWDYRNGFLLMSGKLTEKEAQGLLRVAAKQQLGMSHGFVALRDPQGQHLIKFYRSYEASDLPLKSAANAFTDVNALLKQEVKPMSKDKAAYLTEVLGEEQAARILKDAEDAQKLLDGAGVESKENEEEKEGSDDGGSPKETVEVKESPALDKLVELITEKVAKSLDLDALETWVETTSKSLELLPAIAKALDNMQKDSDEQLAEIIEAPVTKARRAWSVRESESKDNIVEDDDPLKETTKESGDNWLSNLAGAPALEGDPAPQLSGGIQHYDA